MIAAAMTVLLSLFGVSQPAQPTVPDKVEELLNTVLSGETPPKDLAVIRSAIDVIQAELNHGYDRRKGLRALDYALLSLVIRTKDSAQAADARARRVVVLHELAALEPENRELSLAAINALPDPEARIPEIESYLARFPNDVNGLKAMAIARANVARVSGGSIDVVLAAFRRWGAALTDDELVLNVEGFRMLSVSRLGCDANDLLRAIAELESVAELEARHLEPEGPRSDEGRVVAPPSPPRWRSTLRPSALRGFREALANLKCAVTQTPAHSVG